MSADLLRRAATLMRERAAAATPSADPKPGGWAGYSRPGDLGDARIYGGPVENGYRTTAVLEFTEYLDCDNCSRPTAADVEHITSWHPSVAVAVAHLLTDAADYWDRNYPGEDVPDKSVSEALTVARAYLGES